MKHFNTLNDSRTTTGIQQRTKRWLYSLTLLFATIITGISFGQVSTYAFSQSSGTYTPITGGTLIKNTGTTSIDDDVYTNLDIGFTFNYNGTDYTKFSIASNGFIALGSTVATSTTPISGTTNNVISPLGDDLIGRQFVTGSTTNGNATVTVTAGSTSGMAVGDMLTGTGIATGATITGLTGTTITMSANATSTGTGRNIRSINCGNIRYEVIGTAPNRTLVIQWNKYSRYTTASPSDYLNFQIRLNEGTNVINVIYDFPYVYSTTSITNDVGLRGAATTDYNNRTSTTSWASTTAGASNTATITLTGTVFPASGQTFTWTPPVIATDLALQSISGIPTSACSTSSVPLSVVIKNNGTNTLDFSATNATITLNITGASTQTLSATLSSGTLASGATQTVSLSPNANFSVAGTHSLSATLSMTGDQVSGNNTVTGSRVIASAPVAAPWAEGFATTSTPTGWNITGWTIGTSHGQTANGIYKNMWSSATTGQFNTTPVGALGSSLYQLKFDYRVLNYNSTYPGTQVPPTGNWGNFKVQISTDCGVSYTDLETINNTNHTVTDQSWTTKTYSLASYNGQNVMVRIVATWVAGDYFIDIDNFDISELSTDQMDWNNIQWLSDGTNGSNSSLSVPAGTTVTAYAQGYEAGVTEAAGAGTGVQCWIGYSSTNSDPSGSGWTWTAATYLGQGGSPANNDEFSVALPALSAGTYYTAARWKLNSGTYTYGGYNGPWNGTGNNNIELIVTPNPTQCASNPTPANGATNVTRGTIPFSWSAPSSGPVPTSYKVYSGTTSGSLTLTTTVTTTTVNLTIPSYNTTYYWKVVPTSTVGGDATGCTEWSFTTEASPFAPYCDVPNFATNVEPITLVNFAGINNSTSATLNGTPSHENFIAQQAAVTAGQSYDITLKGNTDGTYTNNFRVFIDWNHDNDFADSGETFTAGSIYNSTGVDAVQAVTSIAIPSNALAGVTRMRVKKLFGTTSIDDPCLSGGYGQVEEYTVNVTVPATNWANLQWPHSSEFNFMATDVVYGRVFVPGLTDTTSGQASGVQSWVGLSTANTNPNTWAEASWKAASFNMETDSNNNDEYMATVGFISGTDYVLPGKYYYATRFQVGTDPYMYGGNKLIASPNEGGLWDGTTYKSGTLTVLTQILPDLCGTSFSHPNNRIDAIGVDGANKYRFEFVENGNTTVLESTINGVQFSALGAAMKYNTPYQVRVAWSTDNGATWTNYGAACTVTLTQTTSVYRGCGTTYTNPNMRVEAFPLAGATEYTFEFTNTATSAVTEVVSAIDYTTFGAGSLAQGAYDIRVKAKVNGVYSPYGTTCNITYAIPLDTSRVLATMCGTVLSHSNNRIIAEARTGATAWMFKFEGQNGTTEVAATSNYSTFSALGANLLYDTPYNVSVKYQKDGVWSAYGPACSLSVSQITYVYVGCGSTYTEAYRIQALPILNATEYTFEFTNASSVVTEIVSTNPYMTFGASGLAAGAYSIRVKAKANGVYGVYGSTCSITYAPAAARIIAYPNPFVSSFTIDVKDASVLIYDQRGLLVEQYKVANGKKPEMGTNLSKGLYFVHVKEGSETKIIQVIKK